MHSMPPLFYSLTAIAIDDTINAIACILRLAHFAVSFYQNNQRKLDNPQSLFVSFSALFLE